MSETGPRRIGFLVGALPYFKLFGPVIEEALREGLDVTLLLRDPPELRSGRKAYQRAVPEQVPRFHGGRPQVRQWDSDASLAAVCERDGIETVVSIWLYPRDYNLCRLLRAQGIRWVALQHRIEHLIMPVQTLLEPDVNCVFSPFWADHAVRFFEGRLAAQNPTWDQTRQALRSKMAVTGYAQLDAHAQLDPDAIRRRYGIPSGKPVVAWLPHDYHDWDMWEVLAFRREWRPRPLLRALRARRWDVLAGLAGGPTEAGLARSLRAFCDRNGAFLLVKSRIKDRPSAWDRKIADLFLFDQSYYPPTIMEVLAVADLCVHVFSVTAMEAAAMKVPGLCLVPPAASAFVSDPDTAWARTSGDLTAPDTLWNFAGVAHQLSMADAVRRLPGLSLDAFRLDASRRREYLDRFVGPVDGRSARRVLDAALGQESRKPVGVA